MLNVNEKQKKKIKYWNVDLFSDIWLTIRRVQIGICTARFWPIEKKKNKYFQLWTRDVRQNLSDAFSYRPVVSFIFSFIIYRRVYYPYLQLNTIVWLLFKILPVIAIRIGCADGIAFPNPISGLRDSIFLFFFFSHYSVFI